MKMLSRALLNVVTWLAICCAAVGCGITFCAGRAGGGRTVCFCAGFFLLVSTVMVGSVPGAGCACGVGGAPAGAGVCAEAVPPR